MYLVILERLSRSGRKMTEVLDSLILGTQGYTEESCQKLIICCLTRSAHKVPLRHSIIIVQFNLKAICHTRLSPCCVLLNGAAVTIQYVELLYFSETVFPQLTLESWDGNTGSSCSCALPLTFRSFKGSCDFT